MTKHEECYEYENSTVCIKYDGHGVSIPESVVSIPEAAYESRLGRLFSGQTELITFDHEYYAWGGLINPSNSGVDLFIEAFTISNFTATPFVGQIWYNTTLPSGAHVSNKVSPDNTALRPLPEPKAKLEYASDVEEKPRGGVNPFLRIAEPYSTLAAEQNGSIIIPPGGNFVIILKSIEHGSRQLTAKIVFSWWEEKIKRASCND